MKAISIRQPWLWAICRGGKDVENRSNRSGLKAAVGQFSPASGHDILLHASSRWEGEEAYRVVRHLSPVDPGLAGVPASDTAWFGDGGFVAVARVEAVHTSEACYDPLSGRLCSPWAQENAAHLQLTDVRVLHRPVPYRGSQGLFTVGDSSGEEATRMTTRICRTCNRPFTPVAKARYCSPTCRCGTDAGYNAGCRCTRCKNAHAQKRTRLHVDPNPLVRAVGTKRRIRALARLGWSSAELSRQLGMHRSYLLKVLLRDMIEPETADQVARLYDQLSMTICTDPTAARTAAAARRRGWVPPLGWDDETIDDPKARSCTRVPGRAVDEVAIQRALAGEWSIPTTVHERVEICARWTAAGRTLRQLELITGWNTARYVTPADRADDEPVAS